MEEPKTTVKPKEKEMPNERNILGVAGIF